MRDENGQFGCSQQAFKQDVQKPALLISAVPKSRAKYHAGFRGGAVTPSLLASKRYKKS